MTRDELLAFFPKRLSVAEIGVLAGDFSESILIRADPRKLFLVDLWGQQDAAEYADTANRSDDAQERLYAKVVKRFENSPAVTIIRGMSTVVMPHLADLDWLYIDANHGYDAVLADLTAAAQCINADGFLAGHDYADAARDGTPFGVIGAIDTFLVQNPEWKLRFITDERWASWVMSKATLPWLPPCTRL